MGYIGLRRLSLACVFAFAAASPACADERFSVALSPYIVVPSGGTVSEALGQVAIGYDLGPSSATKVPVRVRVDASYFLAGGNDGVFSGGISARLTTPLYLGAGVTLDSGTLIGSTSGPVLVGPYPVGGPARNGPNPGGAIAIFPNSYPTPHNSGAGATVFFGQEVVSRPGFGLDLELTFHYFPPLGNQSSNGFGLGVRTRF
jgi:hypothetical protein